MSGSAGYSFENSTNAPLTDSAHYGGSAGSAVVNAPIVFGNQTGISTTQIALVVVAVLIGMYIVIK